jgi:hypothetical protein
MRAPFFLLMLSAGGLAAAVSIEGLSDGVLIAVPCVLASLFLLLRESGTGAGAQEYVVIDGSNAMHWKDGKPEIETLHDLVKRLSTLGFTPGVIFDANAGYLLTGKYQNSRQLEKLLRLPRDRVIVVPKGTPADPTILEAARHLNARVVTNDRYRGWADTFPEIRKAGHLIKGGYRSGELWLDVENRAMA